MVNSTRSNDPPSSPTRASMENTSLIVIPQKSPQTTPSHGANVDETVGATIPSHVSSIVPATTSTVAAVTQSNADFGNSLVENPWSFDPSNLRNQPYGMPPSFMVGLHNNPSNVSENLNAVHPQFYYPGPSVPSSNPQQSLTNASQAALRQQMEGCNHEMVNMLTQKIGTVFNPLIRDTHNSYLALSDQMTRIADFFGVPPRRNVQIPQVQNPRPVEVPVNRPNDRNPANLVPQPVVEPQVPRVQERVPILVQRNQDPNQIIRQAQQELVKTGDLLKDAEKAQKGKAVCSEIVGSEALSSEATETIGNTSSHTISNDITELESTSTSHSSDTIDDIPLSKVYKTLEKSLAPSPSTKNQKKPADDVFEPMYPIGELAQMRIVVCQKLPTNHPLQHPFIQPLQTIALDEQFEGEQPRPASDNSETTSSSSQPQPTTQTNDPSVLEELANHYKGELSGFKPNPEDASETVPDNVVSESPQPQEPNS